MELHKPLIDQWPSMSFAPLEEIEIENRGVRIFYQSFFKMLRFPEDVAKAFYVVLTEESEIIEGEQDGN